MLIQNFDFYTCWSSGSADNRFKGFRVRWQLMFKVNFGREWINWRLWTFLYVSRNIQLDYFTRGCFIGKLEEGWQIANIVNKFDIDHIVGSQFLKAFQRTGMCSRRHGRGHFHNLMASEDMYLILLAKQDLCWTSNQVVYQSLSARIKRITVKTVARLQKDCSSRKIVQHKTCSVWLAHCRVESSPYRPFAVVSSSSQLNRGRPGLRSLLRGE